MTSRADRVADVLLSRLTSVEKLIAVAGLFVTAGALLVDIVARELLRASMFGSLRIAVYAMATTALLGFCVCVAAHAHIRVTAFDGLVPAGWRPMLHRLADLVSFAICCVFAYLAGSYVRETQLVGETDVALNVVIWPFQLALVWMFVSAAIRYGLFALFPAVRPEEGETLL